MLQTTHSSASGSVPTKDRAVVIRTSRYCCFLQNGFGDSLILEGKPPLPLPGMGVIVRKLGPRRSEHELLIVDAQFDIPSASDVTRSMKAERWYKDGLAARQEKDSERAWKKLEESFNTGWASAQACLALVDIGLLLQKYEPTAAVIRETLHRFAGARTVEQELAVKLAVAGQSDEAFKVLLDLAQVRGAALNRQLVKEVVRLGLQRVLVDPTSGESITILEHLSAVVGRAKRTKVPIEDGARVRFLEALASSDSTRQAVHFLTSLGFELRPRGDKQGALRLTARAPDSLIERFHDHLKRDDEVYVVIDNQPDWKAVEGISKELDEWRRGRQNRASFGLSISPRTTELEAVYTTTMASAMASQSAFLVPIDIALCSEQGGASIATIEDAMRRYVLRRDWFLFKDPVYGDGFFGREDEFRRFSSLVNDGHHVGVFGLRKMGKTSFLKQLVQVRPHDLVVYLDLQSAVQVREMPSLWWHFAKTLVTTFLDRPQINHTGGAFELGASERWDQKPRPDRNGARFHNDLLRVLDDLLRCEPSFGRIILAIDEIEYLLPCAQGAIESGEEFFCWARGVFQQTNGRVVTVVTGANPLVTELGRIAGRDNPMFQLYQELFVPPLRRSETDEMIRVLGQRMGIQFQTEALDSIAVEAGGHPYITRLLCSHVIQKFERPSVVTADDVQRSIADFLIEKAAAFNEILDRLRDLFPEEYDLLAAMYDTPFTASDLEELVGAPVETTLKHLIGYQLLTPDKDGRYHLRFELLKRWLDRERKFRGKR